MLFGLLLRLQVIFICVFTLSLLIVQALGRALPHHNAIVYIGEDQHGTDIHLLDVKLHIISRLGIPLPSPGVPRLSPDGQQITFFSESEIYIVDVDGENLQSLEGYSPRCRKDSPQWVAEDQQIAYISVCGSQHNIQVIALKDEKIAQVSKDLGLVWQMDWSPDGQQFVFGGMDGEIYTYDMEGQMRQLTSNAIYDFAPAWSPDGERIAFVSVDAYGVSRVELIDADGSDQHALIEGFTPTWSPDGSQIVFANDVMSTNGVMETQIFRMNADGSDLEQLTFQGMNYHPDW